MTAFDELPPDLRALATKEMTFAAARIARRANNATRRLDFEMAIATGRHASRKFAKANVRIQDDLVLRFVVDYPLARPATIEVTHDDGRGWTQRQFVEAVRDAYLRIYEEEGPYPGEIANTCNRATSDGAYGIWGHAIDDLYLEGAWREADGAWRLVVGS